MVEVKIGERLTAIEEKLSRGVDFTIDTEKAIPLSPSPPKDIEPIVEPIVENNSNVVDSNFNSLPGGSPSVSKTFTPKRAILSRDNAVIKRLSMDKKSFQKEDFKKPDISLTSDQWTTCWRVHRESCSMKNFAARLIMELFDHRDLHMRNCHGRSGKEKIPEEYLKTILFACHSIYGDEMKRDPERGWKECTKAIDTRLRNGNGKSAQRYKGAKLGI